LNYPFLLDAQLSTTDDTICATGGTLDINATQYPIQITASGRTPLVTACAQYVCAADPDTLRWRVATYFSTALRDVLNAAE
jgi:N-acetylmuramic acid 6-phosphate (MurNAc-6-P) etherase